MAEILRARVVAEIRFEEVFQKRVSKAGRGCVVYVPKRWYGRRVAVFLLAEDEEDTGKATPERRERKGE